MKKRCLSVVLALVTLVASICTVGAYEVPRVNVEDKG